MEKKDPQQNAVYAWEYEFRDWAERRIPFADCRAVVETACAHYRVRPPAVRRWRRSYCWCPDVVGAIARTSRILEKPVIWLNASGQNWATCLHEAAHWIQLHLAPRTHDHGPTWLGIYMWLLEKSKIAPRAALVSSANQYKLRWVHRSPESFGVKNGRRRSKR